MSGVPPQAAQAAEIGERILEAAEHLFYGQGIQAIGVDAIAAAAHVSKRTLYRHFPSKDLLVAAYLQRRAHALISHEGDPCERVLKAFAGLEHWFASSRFRGCPFVNAVSELGAEPTHPAVVVAVRLKEERRAWFERAMREAGADDPADLADQLMIVFEGAIATALVRGGGAGIARSAKAAVMTLLAGAGITCAATPAPRRRA
ncbi:MAG: TetR/AcrR family transcriptional regulator [Burkholderiaceae bacterium]|jgi:AcrR family transcriptional regulator|nr:TetR/AcrR family transcriptional regulator [Burkholderiaceae bacterium]MEB2318509.1 TetR/AcrR family transcriptional regulator [Pseudomonadota bacterium]